MLIGSPTSRASARPTERGRSATCARRDLNPHTRGHQNLNLARLPIPPLARVPIAAEDPTGLITFAVPAGEHRVEVRWGATPLRLALVALSLSLIHI